MFHSDFRLPTSDFLFQKPPRSNFFHTSISPASNHIQTTPHFTPGLTRYPGPERQNNADTQIPLRTHLRPRTKIRHTPPHHPRPHLGHRPRRLRPLPRLPHPLTTLRAVARAQLPYRTFHLSRPKCTRERGSYVFRPPPPQRLPYKRGLPPPRLARRSPPPAICPAPPRQCQQRTGRNHSPRPSHRDVRVLAFPRRPRHPPTPTPHRQQRNPPRPFAPASQPRRPRARPRHRVALRHSAAIAALPGADH